MVSVKLSEGEEMEPYRTGPYAILQLGYTDIMPKVSVVKLLKFPGDVLAVAKEKELITEMRMGSKSSYHGPTRLVKGIILTSFSSPRRIYCTVSVYRI